MAGHAPEQWNGAIQAMLTRRNQLVLPLPNHNYLYRILVGLSDKAEAQAERVTEEQRKAHFIQKPEATDEVQRSLELAELPSLSV